MKGKILGTLFLALVFVQISVPFSMIMKREELLSRGALFKFKTAPVDPYDAFRGRYVALNVDAGEVPVPGDVVLKYGQKVYALIVVDDQGFAHVSGISLQRPGNAPFMMARVNYMTSKKVMLLLPIDRYYMEETLAPQAEMIYRRNSSAKSQDAYVLVRILGGEVLVEGLYINGKNIEEIARTEKMASL